jgi:serine/threonine protein kinase
MQQQYSSSLKALLIKMIDSNPANRLRPADILSSSLQSKTLLELEHEISVGEQLKHEANECMKTLSLKRMISF